VNNDSDRASFFIHSVPEWLFTSPRNPYSHQPGTIIHMPRNTQEDELAYDYLQGRLSSRRSSQFESTFGATERGRQNLAFARSQRAAERAGGSGIPAHTRTRTQRGRPCAAGTFNLNGSYAAPCTAILTGQVTGRNGRPCVAVIADTHTRL
jgi:hypothetical protein